jgi:DNA polymerase-1
MAPKAKTLHLIDGSAQFHRAYHAIRGLTTSRGLPSNATYGFTTMLRKLYVDESPEYVAISFDLAGPTFRHDEYSQYKANRPKMDDDLAVQIPYVRRVCEALRLPIIEVPGFEADDVIATLSHQAVAQGFRVVVVSGDKDLLQMVTDQVVVLNPGREGMGAVLYDAKKVEEKWGVPPDKVVDVLGLVGDSVDNIPGVPGIGDKGARDLIREFGSLEGALENADKVKRAAYREGLKTHRDDAILSKRLATLRLDAPVVLDLPALARRPPDRAAAHALFTELEFQAIAKEYAPEPAAATTTTRVLRTLEEVEALAADARRSGRLAIATVATSAEAMRARLLGVALAVTPGEAAYLPLGHSRLEVPEPLDPASALERLRPALEDPEVRKLSAQAKRDRLLFARQGVEVRGLVFDALVASYLLNPGRRGYTLDDLALEFLGQRVAEEGEGIAGEAASLDATSRTAGQSADVVLRLHEPVR